MCLQSFFFFTSLEENVSTTSNEDANELTIKRKKRNQGNKPFVAKYTISRRKLTRREIQLAPSGAAFPTSCINLRHVVYLAHAAPECLWFGGGPVLKLKKKILAAVKSAAAFGPHCIWRKINVSVKYGYT